MGFQVQMSPNKGSGCCIFRPCGVGRDEHDQKIV